VYQYKHQQLLARSIKIFLKYLNISKYLEGVGVPSEKKNTSCPPTSVGTLEGKTTFARPSSRWNIKTDLTEVHVRARTGFS
jgi:hypothetical protein